MDNASSGHRSIRVMPSAALRGTLTVPGDKSVSHRAVILGSIADGMTEVDGFLAGEDNLCTIKAFESLGVEITRVGDRLSIRGRGLNGLKEPEDVIDAGNSGTTARLLTGLLSAQTFFTVLTGDASLRKRPMKRVVEPLTLMGANIRGRSDNTLLPLAVSGRPLTGISYRTPVASAQVKSSILLAGLYAEGETTVVEPDKSRDHTERMFGAFGADIEVSGNKVTVRSTKSIKGCRIKVPGDISSAAFFMVGASVTPESELLVKNVGVNPTRTGIISILRKMGASLEVVGARDVSNEPVADISVRSAHLKGVEITGPELLPAIDEFPIICVAAAMAEGTTRISGAEELRVKESDRVAVMAGMLKDMGVGVEEKPDGIIIEGVGGKPLRDCAVDSRGDHRIAMAAAIAALGSAKGITIDDAGCVDVSFPGFFSLLGKLSGRTASGTGAL